MKHLIVKTKQYQLLGVGFKEWLMALGYSDSTIRKMPTGLNEFFHFLESQNIYDVKMITPDLVIDYMEAFKNRPNYRREGGLSPSYFNKQLQVLKLFSTYLRKTHQGGFAIDIKAEKAQRPKPDILTVEQIKCLYEAVEDNPFGERDKAVLGIYYGAGLRRTEGAKLDVSDVLFEQGLVYVRHGKNYQERYVPVSHKVLQDLKNYIDSGRSHFTIKDKETDSLLVSQMGNRIDGMTALNRLRKLQKMSGDTDIISKSLGLHTLRHSIATHLLKQGMELQKIAQFLGHKSIESTQIYTHLIHEL